MSQVSQFILNLTPKREDKMYSEYHSVHLATDHKKQIMELKTEASGD